MRLGNILTKKFLISFVCVLFTAIISLCGANLVNTYLMDTTSGYQETVTDDDESSESDEDDVETEASGNWSDNVDVPGTREEGWNAGSASNPYVIETARELAYILVAPDKHYVFSDSCTSIDMSAHYWDARSTVFESGSLIGPDSGVTIYNIVLSTGILYGSTYYFLPEIQENYIVSNLIIDVTNGGFIGIAVDSKISNITVISSNTQTEKGWFGSIVYVAGGIVSEAENVTIQNCINMADISTGLLFSSSAAGGIVGELVGGYNIIQNCVNYGYINGLSYVGGIVGESSSRVLSITRCINYGRLNSKNSDGYVGGIVGALTGGNYGYITYCINARSDAEFSAYYIGGLVGVTRTHLTMTYCRYASYENTYWGLIAAGQDKVYTDNIFLSTNTLNTNSSYTNGVLRKSKVSSYMSTFGFAYNNNLNSTWTTATVYSLGSQNFSSEMVTLSFFVNSFNIAIQNEVQTGINQYDYQLDYDSDGYYAIIYNNDNDGDITVDGDGLQTYYYIKNPYSQVVFTVECENKARTSSLYNFLGIFDGIEMNDKQLSSEKSYVAIPLNLSGDYIIRSELIKNTYSFKTASYNGFLNNTDINNSVTLTQGTEGGYISTYRVDMRYSDGDRRSTGTTTTLNSDKIEFKNNSYLTSITFEIKLQEGYEFYGLFGETALGGSDNLQIYAGQDLKPANEDNFVISNSNGDSLGVENNDSTGDSNTIYFTIQLFNSLNLSEFNYVFVFTRYQYEIDININNFEVKNDTSSTYSSSNLRGYYGYAGRVYHRSDLTPKLSLNGSYYSINEFTIVSNTSANKYLGGEYNWYLGYIETDELDFGNDGKLAFSWGGTEGFYFDETEKELEDIVECIGDYSDDRKLTLDLSKLFGIDSQGNLDLTDNETVNITLKKFVVDPDENYIKDSEDTEDNSVGGKYVTYSYYVLDVYDSSVETDVNNYVFGSNGGTTSLSKLTSVNGNQYYSVNVTHVNNLAVTNNNGELEVTSGGSISGYRIDFTLFLFYDFNFVDFDKGDPLSSGWDLESLNRKDDENTGGNFTLNSIVNITKVPVNGYYYNGFTVNYFQVHNSNFNSSISIDNLNSSLKDLSTAGNDLYTLANGASSATKVYLLSYYSLTTFTLNLNIESESNNNLTLRYILSINNDEIYNNLTSGNTSGNIMEFYNIKSYSKIEINVDNYAVYFRNDNYTFYKFSGLNINGESATSLSNYSFQLISDSEEVNTEINVGIVYSPVYTIKTISLERDKNGYYLISSPENLFYIMYRLNSSSENFEGYKFKQTCDIDMSGYNFLPIGSEYIPFRGSYDGQYYSIKNLNIDAGNLSNVGLFGYVENATIKNLNFVGGSITGFNNVGVIGYAENSTITRVNNYSCEIKATNSISNTHIYLISENSVIDSESSSTDGEETTYNLSAEDFNSSLLLRVIQGSGLNDYDFVVGGEDGKVAFGSTALESYNIGGLLGTMENGSVSISSSKGAVNIFESIDDSTSSDEETQDNTENQTSDLELIQNRGIAGFVGYVSGGTISNCYTSQATFAGKTENSSLTCCHTGISDVTDLTDSDCDCESKFNW